MPQLDPPAAGPARLMEDPPFMPPPVDESARWSVAAVSGFVLSLLGCMGITAAAGLVLGVVGLSSTKDGRRRGRGLAIAAIPISLVNAAVSVVLIWLLVLVAGAAAAVARLPTVLGSDASGAAKAAAALRTLASEDFTDSVGEEKLTIWIQEITAAHGRLVDVPKVTNTKTYGNRFALEMSGRFVNGPATILLTFVLYDYTNLRLDDIDVNGSAPRAVK